MPPLSSCTFSNFKATFDNKIQDIFHKRCQFYAPSQALKPCGIKYHADIIARLKTFQNSNQFNLCASNYYCSFCVCLCVAGERVR